MNIMKEAHRLTKQIKAEYPTVDYKAQLGICISYLSKNEGEKAMVELKGTEKQVAWAEKIKKSELDMLHKLEKVTTNTIEVACGWDIELNVTETEITKIYKKEEKFQRAKENLKETIKFLENEESAKFLIENRENLSIKLCEKKDKKFLAHKLLTAFNEDVIKINL